MSKPAPAVFLILGDDPTLRGEALRTLVAELLGDDDASLALEDFTLAKAGDAKGPDDSDGGDSRGPVLAAALNAASTPPFGTDRRVVVLRDVGLLTTAEAEAVVRYLADPSPTTALVLVGGGGRIPVALTKAVKAAGGREVRTESEKTADALAAALRRTGVDLTPAAARRVAEWFGDDAGRVPGLLDLLASTHGPGVRLDVDDVEPYLGTSGSVAPFHLTGAIDKGDTEGALEVLHRLTGSGFHPLQVMVLLHRRYQQLLRLDDPSIAGESEAVAALSGKVKPYPAKLALTQSRRLGYAGIREAYGFLAKADLDLRGATAVPEDAVLDVLVARLAGISRRAGAGSTPARGRRR